MKDFIKPACKPSKPEPRPPSLVPPNYTIPVARPPRPSNRPSPRPVVQPANQPQNSDKQKSNHTSLVIVSIAAAMVCFVLIILLTVEKESEESQPRLATPPVEPDKTFETQTTEVASTPEANHNDDYVEPSLTENSNTIELTGQSGTIIGLAFTKDKRKVVSMSTKMPFICVWDIETQSLKTRATNEILNDLSVLPTGEFIAGNRATGNIVKINPYQASATLFHDVGSSYKEMTVSADGQRIAILDNDIIRFLDTNSKAIYLEIPLDYRSDEIKWSPTEPILAVISRQRNINFYDAITGTLTNSTPNRNERIFRISWSPNGDRIASNNIAGTRRFTVDIWNPSTGETEHSFEAKRRVTTMDWSPDGRLFATGSIVGNVVFYDSQTFAKLHELKITDDRLTRLRFSENGDLIVTGTQNGSIKVSWVPGLVNQ